MRRVITVDDSIVRIISSDAVLKRLLPEVGLGSTKSSCKPCQQRRQNSSSTDKLKRAIANMSQDKLTQIKKHLKADKLRISYPLPGGRVADITV